MAFAESSRETSGFERRHGHSDRRSHTPAPTRYLDQSASALSWNLVEGDVDATCFTLLASASLFAPGFVLHAHIVGASHLLRMEWDEGAVYHEVVACAGLPETAKRVASARLATQSTGETAATLAGRRSLRFASQIVDSANAGVRLRALDQSISRAAARGNQEIGLRFEFPSRAPDAGAANETGPLTLLHAALSQRNERVRIESAHSYPNEARVVFTQTSISIAACEGASE